MSEPIPEQVISVFASTPVFGVISAVSTVGLVLSISTNAIDERDTPLLSDVVAVHNKLSPTSVLSDVTTSAASEPITVPPLFQEYTISKFPSSIVRVLVVVAEGSEVMVASDVHSGLVFPTETFALSDAVASFGSLTVAVHVKRETVSGVLTKVASVPSSVPS